MLILRLLIVSLLVPTAVAAQSPPRAVAIEVPAADVIQELKLNDGSSVIGRVQSVGEGRFVFRRRPASR